jgi:hypothetical protein
MTRPIPLIEAEIAKSFGDLIVGMIAGQKNRTSRIGPNDGYGRYIVTS